MEISIILKKILRERAERNPSYSLRAFARDLGVSPGHLCEVLSGRHRLSHRLSMAISEKLGLPKDEDCVSEIEEVAYSVRRS